MMFSFSYSFSKQFRGLQIDLFIVVSVYMLQVPLCDSGKILKILFICTVTDFLPCVSSNECKHKQLYCSYDWAWTGYYKSSVQSDGTY